MRNRSCIDSIDNYKSAVYLSIYRGGGLDPLQTNFQAYPLILANNRSTKLGTLICSAHARTVRPTDVDCPDRGPSGLRTGPSARSIWCSTDTPHAAAHERRHAHATPLHTAPPGPILVHHPEDRMMNQNLTGADMIRLRKASVMVVFGYDVT
jgi:hypothetical protein